MHRPLIIALAFLICGILTAKAQSADSQPDSSAIKLSEVTVSASNVKQHGNVMTYTITKQMRKNVNSAGELLGRLTGLYYDPATLAVKYMGSANVVILVDSLERDASYIKQLNPNRFDRIDVVNMPSGRYAGCDAVINFHTKPLYQGYDVNLGERVTLKPGGRNGRGKDLNASGTWAYATYTREKWNFVGVLYYTFSQTGTTNYGFREYPRNGYRETFLVTDRKKATGYTRQNTLPMAFAADYTFNKNHSVSLQWDVTPSGINSTDDYTVLAEHLNTGSSEKISVYGGDKYKDMLENKLSAYYRGNINGWSLNATATMNFANFDRLYNRTMSGRFTLTDNRKFKNRYFWGGFDLSKTFRKVQLSLSDYLTAASFKQRHYEDNTPITSTHSVSNRVSVTAQYFPSRNLAIGGEIGFEVYHNSQNEKNADKTTPRLGLWWNYSPCSNIFMNFNYIASSNNPTSTELADYGTFTDSLVYRTGNPELKPAVTHQLFYSVTFLRMITLRASYSHTSDRTFPIVGIAEGPLANGIVAPYARFSYFNGNYNHWSVFAMFQKYFKKNWNADISLRYLGYSARYRNHKISKNLPKGSASIGYVSDDGNFRAQFNMEYSNQLSVGPQSYSKTVKDTYSLFLQKLFFNKQLQISMLYSLPVHFLKGESDTWLNSDALVEHTWRDDNYANNNWMQFTVVYTLRGGDKVRKYARPTIKVE